MPWNESRNEQQRPLPPKPKLGRWVRIVASALMAASLAWGWLIVEMMRGLLRLPGCTPEYLSSTIFHRLLNGPGPLLVLGACCYAGASRIAKALGRGTSLDE